MIDQIVRQFDSAREKLSKNRSPILTYYCISLIFLLLAQYPCDENLKVVAPLSKLWLKVVLSNLMIAYFFVYNTFQKEDFKKIWIILFIVICCLLCLTPPGFSTDINEYLMRGRTLVIYGKNPYLYPPSSFPQDFVYSLVSWHSMPETYGPLFVAIESIPAYLFPGSLTGERIVMKLLTLLFYLIGVLFFYKICRKHYPDYAARLTALFALNPLSIVRSLIDGHNDIIMTSFMIGAVYYFLNLKYSRCFIFLAFAFAIKFPALLLFPILFVHLFFKQLKHGFWSAIRGCSLQLAVLALSLFFLFVPLWAGFDTFKAVFAIFLWLNPHSIPYLFYLGFSKLGIAVNLIDISVISKGFLVIGYCSVIRHLIFKRSDSVRFLSRIIFLAYWILYVSLTGLPESHYLIWILPWFFLSFWPQQGLILFFYLLIDAICFHRRFNFIFLAAFVAYMSITLLQLMLKKPMPRPKGTC